MELKVHLARLRHLDDLSMHKDMPDFSCKLRESLTVLTNLLREFINVCRPDPLRRDGLFVAA